MAVRASWKPNHQGTYLHGIPARSLTDEDWDALSPEDRQRVEDSGLYSMRSDAETHPPSPTSTSSSEKKDDGKP